MDIKKLITGASVPLEETPVAKTRGKEGPRIPTSEHPSGDRVTLRAKSMTPEAAAAESVSPEEKTLSRADKVKMLKEAVQRGVYQPDMQDVARNLLFSDFKPLA